MGFVTQSVVKLQRLCAVVTRRYPYPSGRVKTDSNIFAMNLKCNSFQILVVCFIQLAYNQVDAKNHSLMDKYIGEYYGKYEVKDYPQGLKNYTEVYELDKEKEMPKLIIKKIGKHKKKWKKTEEKEKYIMMKKKKISKNKMKRKKPPAKFMKTVSDKNRDSNLSDSKEDDMARKPDIVVHIVK